MSQIFRRLALSLSVLTLLGLVACTVSDPKDPRFLVAKGKGVKVTRAELTDALNELLSQNGMNMSMLPQDKLPDIEKNIVDRLVVEKLLLDASKSVSLKDVDKKVDEKYKEISGRFPSPDVFKQQLEKRGMTPEKLKTELTKEVTIEQTVEAKVPEPAAPSEAEIEAFYTENAAKFNRDAMVRASHVLIMVKPDASPAEKAAKKKIADDARARVVKGEAFAKVAQEVSEDKGSAANGGDLDFFRKGMMVPEFEKVAFNAKVGEVSQVFETPFGYHFLIVTDTKPAGKVPLAEAHDKIAAFLKNKVRGEALKTYIKNLKDTADVKVTLPEIDGAAKAPAAAPAGAAPAMAPATPAAPAPTAPPAK